MYELCPFVAELRGAEEGVGLPVDGSLSLWESWGEGLLIGEQRQDPLTRPLRGHPLPWGEGF